ncbi:TetR/AcrR family transcriptional regulator [Geodermatophilus sabuli]|uniref:TetR/AcrR family transcriptional regulator n=1 Tax=Geodermatophilus sabuli TaxID=1564158 RepID=A0A7K3W5C3_9ACTN|nr:TetR/AcrR family transcriptional regulator [Geodermatophilus sabuli]NEK60032.1 TetR/AcrR family transcriptional regulator [Geodermatophilus sabuli]
MTQVRAPRRRGTEVTAAIEAAVMAIVVEKGADAVTMEAVAARAGTSKPVLYRRWPDRAALLRDVLLRRATGAIPAEDTGSYRTDMLAILRGWAAVLTGPGSRVIQAIVAAMAQDPDFAAAFREGVIGWRKREMADLLARGIDRGDVRPDVPVEIARELGQGILWHRFLITGDPIDDEVVVQIVDEVLVPFVSPARSSR